MATKKTKSDSTKKKSKKNTTAQQVVKIPEGDRATRLKALAGIINKEYGKNTVGTGRLLKRRIPRMPFSIMSVDMATQGGAPLGMMTALIGQESGGKTLLAKKLVVSAQQHCSNCNNWCIEEMDEETGELTLTCDCEQGYREFVVAYCDAEGTFNSEWAETLGIDMDRLLFSQPDHAEQAIDVIDAWLRGGDVDLIVLDSVAALCPIEEVEKASEEDIVGTHAKKMNAAWRKWGSALNYVGRKNNRRPTLVFINQLRLKVGVLYGNPETRPGGKGQLYFPALTIKVWSESVEYIDDRKKTDPLWATKRFKIEKSKIGTAYTHGEFTIVISSDQAWLEEAGRQPGEIMEEEYVFDQMKRRRLLEMPNREGTIYLVDGERLNGKGQVVAHWLENPDAFEQARDVLLNSM